MLLGSQKGGMQKLSNAASLFFGAIGLSVSN